MTRRKNVNIRNGWSGGNTPPRRGGRSGIYLRKCGLVAGMLLGLMCPMARGDGPGDESMGGSSQPSFTKASDKTPIFVAIGRSVLVQAPWPVKRVSVTDPKIADIQVFTPTQVLVSGRGNGTTDLFVWGEADQALEAPVVVSADRSAMRGQLKQLLPDSDLDMWMSNDVLIVSGTLRRADEAMTLHKYLDATGTKYVDTSTVAGPQQVQIKVILAEANRTAIRTLGVNALEQENGFSGIQSIGADNSGPLNPLSSIPSPTVPITPALTLAGDFDNNFFLFIQALAQNQYLRVLAEPTLVAMSGQEASFLAGGEFPIPVVQSSSGGTNSNSITVTYKDFGVNLVFRPTVLGDGVIRLEVAPEVSELTTGTGSVEIEGFSIPGLLTRKADTTLEMHSGQTLIMGGLIDQETQARSSEIPGLGDLPVLGTLFRSVRYQQDDTELVMLVTASLVSPESETNLPALPGGTHVTPNDWELYALGHIDGQQVGAVSDADANRLQQSGLSRLRGPGAWANYNDPTEQSYSSAAEH